MSTHPRRSPRAFAALILSAVLALGMLSGCGPDKGLRVESGAISSPSQSGEVGEDAGQPNTPFGIDEIRSTIIEAAGYAKTGHSDGAAEVVADCRGCLKFSTPFISNDRKFQVVTIANPKHKSEIFAGAVISASEGSAELEMVTTGNQLSLTPGKNGTLVVQEAMYTESDDPCCPSGWSVQVFRLHDGRFEPGQRVTRLNGEE